METGFFSMPIVQIAISIVISWALFALLCSMIHELLVQIKSERGRFMRSKILEKLYDSTNQINWGLQIYNHSNIQLLTKSSVSPPSDISSKVLAETLVDSVAYAYATQILKNKDDITVPNNDLLANLDFAVTHLGQSDVIVLLQNYLKKAKIKGSIADNFNQDKIYESLISDLEIWFDEFGNRTSQWYRKLARKRLFILGLLIAGAMNIDSLALVDFFKENPNTRNSMIAFYTKNEIELEALSAKYNLAIANNKHKDLATVGAVPAATSHADKAKLDSIQSDINKVIQKIQALKAQTDLPIGWDNSFVGSTNTTTHKAFFWEWFYKILGFLISAVAASLGAPFWFDLLKKSTSATTILKPYTK